MPVLVLGAGVEYLSIQRLFTNIQILNTGTHLGPVTIGFGQSNDLKLRLFDQTLTGRSGIVLATGRPAWLATILEEVLMAAIEKASKPIQYWITLATMFVAFTLVATSAHAETPLAVEDLFVWGGGSLLIIAVLVIWAILVIEWIFLPFAIFGIKDRLNKIIDATHKTNMLLEEVLAETTGSDLKLRDKLDRRQPPLTSR